MSQVEPVETMSENSGMPNDKRIEEHLSRGQKYLNDEPQDFQAAVREFQQVVELAPSLDRGHELLSIARQELGQIDEAISARRQAVQLAPEEARHLIALGALLVYKGENSEAIQMLRRGASLKPHYGEADAHIFLASALLADGQTEEACKEWQFVLTLEPMYPSYKVPHKEAKRMLKIHQPKGT